ncbi:MAG: protein kinase [Kofleriaceae bacterium]
MTEADLESGFKVGEYVIEGKLGEGGFGAVFRARHPMIGKLAAVKVLARRYSSDPEMVSRFAAEARAVNQIRHDNIIDIFAFGQLEDGRSYYVMELLDGVTLDAELDETGGLPLGEALPILDGIARALDAAHANGIAHRDLKPHNVFVSRKDGTVHPKLLDFGIAKLFGDANQMSMHRTRTGAPIGTPYYMSPEQCRGQNVDHRTDIYSFGCVAYQLVTGALPFDGDNHLEILMKQTSEEPVPPSKRVADNPALPPLPTQIDDAIAWMMRKDPNDRPPNLAAALRALEEAAGIEVVAQPAVRRSKRAASEPSMSSRRTPPHGAAALAATVRADGVSAPPVAARSKRSPRWLALAVAAAGIAIAIPLAMSSDDEPVASPSPVAAMPAVTPPPAPRPVAQAAIAPEPSRLVTVTITGVPEGTEVFGPSGPLGFAPGAIKLPRSSDDMQLVLRAAGHRDRATKLVPDADRTLEITLDKLATAAAKPKPRAKRTPPTSAKPALEPSKAPATASDPYARH